MFVSSLFFGIVLIAAFSYGRLISHDELPLRTFGRYIVTKQGRRIKLACINWPGAHMNTFVPQGLHIAPPDRITRTIATLGFNCVRLNWSLELVFQNPRVVYESVRAVVDSGQISPNATALDVLDLVVRSCARARIMVVLDNHMSDAGWYSSIHLNHTLISECNRCCDPRDRNGMWFNENYSTRDFQYVWVMMASRYRQEPYVVGVDLRNEIRPDMRFFGGVSSPFLDIKVPGWGTGDYETSFFNLVPGLENYSSPYLTSWRQKFLIYAIKLVLSRSKVKVYDWKAVAKETADNIHVVNPNLLVMVQGTFDFSAYLPDLLSFFFYYMKHDQTLYKSLGRFFSIPDEVTYFSQIHNLTGVTVFGSHLELNIPNRLVYSTHLYPFYYGYNWTRNGTELPSYHAFSEPLNKMWGDIVRKELAPIWVGETGTTHNSSGFHVGWNHTVRFLNEMDLDWSYWPLADLRPRFNEQGEFESGEDEYGVLDRSMTRVYSEELVSTFGELLEPKSGPGITRPPAPPETKRRKIALVVQR